MPDFAEGDKVTYVPDDSPGCLNGTRSSTAPSGIGTVTGVMPSPRSRKCECQDIRVLWAIGSRTHHSDNLVLWADSNNRKEPEKRKGEKEMFSVETVKTKAGWVGQVVLTTKGDIVWESAPQTDDLDDKGAIIRTARVKASDTAEAEIIQRMTTLFE